jgi:hypothetical protein
VFFAGEDVVGARFFCGGNVVGGYTFFDMAVTKTCDQRRERD